MKLSFHITNRGKLADKDFTSLISQYLASSAGRQKLAAAMVQPIRRNLDYYGIARRAIFVDPLPLGALQTYYPEPVSAVQGQRVAVPEFEIFQNPSINISEVKSRRFRLFDRSEELRINSRGKLVGVRSERRFNVIDRAVQKARREIMARQDADIFASINAIAASGNLKINSRGKLVGYRVVKR